MLFYIKAHYYSKVICNGCCVDSHVKILPNIMSARCSGYRRKDCMNCIIFNKIVNFSSSFYGYMIIKAKICKILGQKIILNKECFSISLHSLNKVKVAYFLQAFK